MPPSASSDQGKDYLQHRHTHTKPRTHIYWLPIASIECDVVGRSPCICCLVVHLLTTEVGSWCERDKVVPLKKRRGSFERRASEEEGEVIRGIMYLTEKEKNKTKAKTKTNKKWVQRNGDEEPNQQKEIKEGIDNKKSSGSGKKMSNKRGNVIMEGSRCSRVNGRGWRCCQQTLVGYSLCEHHLGKGRLRSMNNVRSRAEKNEILHSSTTNSSAFEQEKLLQELLDDGEKKPLKMVAKKRLRSMNTVRSHAIAMPAKNPKNDDTFHCSSTSSSSFLQEKRLQELLNHKDDNGEKKPSMVVAKKGLRSMNIVPSRVQKNEFLHRSASSLSFVQETQLQELSDEDDEEEDDGEEKPMMVVAKKRVKLGVVKARSIRSLLGQPDSAALVGDNNHEN